MINIKLNDPVPSAQETAALLTSHNQRLGIPLDYDRLLQYYSYQTLKTQTFRKMIENYIGHKSVEHLKDADFKRFLDKVGVTKYFLKTDGGGVSLSSESIQAAIAVGQLSNEMVAILTKYSEAKKAAKSVDTFAGLIYNNPVIDWPTFDNHRMIVVKPLWVPQNTGRLGMREPAFQNIPRQLQDIFTVPKGFVHLGADSGQIEPKIIYSYFLPDPQIKALIKLYEDAYYGLLHYVEMPESDIRTGRLDFEKKEITPAMKEQRSELKRVANATNYGSQAGGSELEQRYIARIGNHPLRKLWVNKAEEQIMRGNYLFKTAFGEPIDVRSGGKDSYFGAKDSKAYNSHLVRTGINAQVQGTAATAMRISVAKANNIIQRKTVNTAILKYVHDAGYYMISEDEYDMVAAELAETTAYQIEDWIPILSDHFTGRAETDFELPNLY